MKKILPLQDQFSKSDVENLGSAVVALEAKDLKKIPDNVFGDDIIDMFATNIKKSRNTDNKPSKAIISALMEKVKIHIEPVNRFVGLVGQLYLSVWPSQISVHKLCIKIRCT